MLFAVEDAGGRFYAHTGAFGDRGQGRPIVSFRHVRTFESSDRFVNLRIDAQATVGMILTVEVRDERSHRGGAPIRSLTSVVRLPDVYASWVQFCVPVTARLKSIAVSSQEASALSSAIASADT